MRKDVTYVTTSLIDWEHALQYIENGTKFVVQKHFTGFWQNHNDFVWYSIYDNSIIASSNGNIFRVTGHLCGEFTGHRWISRTKTSGAKLWCFLWSAPNKLLSEQWRAWWFETPSRSLWRHCNAAWYPFFFFFEESVWRHNSREQRGKSLYIDM